MSAITPSNYEHLTIDKNGKRVDLSTKTIGFNYYESLLSPTVTANMVVVDTGSVPIPVGKEQNVQGKSGSVLSSLPITGNERLEFKIATKYGKLDFQLSPLYVDGAPGFVRDGNKESYGIALVSKASLDNERVSLKRKYTGKISDNVEKILLNELKIPKNKLIIDSTVHNYNFLGNDKDPFFVILNLASKSVPYPSNNKSGDPGFFFYETRSGMNFRSISNLIKQQPKATYRQTSVLRDDDPNADYKILSFSQSKNQSVINALRSGTFSSKNIFFDPRTFKYKEVEVSLRNKELTSYLGKKPDITAEFDTSNRTHFHILDIGCLDNDVSIKTNNNPELWQAESTTRYNLLFTQVINIVVPCNVSLMAGDIIECYLQNTTTSNKNGSPWDEQMSGKYLIMNLCHSFDTTRSYTSLTLVRDTYGLYSK